MWGAYLPSASVGLVRSALGRRRHEIARRVSPRVDSAEQTPGSEEDQADQERPKNLP